MFIFLGVKRSKSSTYAKLKNKNAKDSVMEKYQKKKKEKKSLTEENVHNKNYSINVSIFIRAM